MNVTAVLKKYRRKMLRKTVMKQLNCWEVLKCGREQGGENVDELGICPVITANEFDGMNNGMCGGRFCWAIAGTLCNGQVQGTYAKKLKGCLQCEFLIRVHEEEGRNFILSQNNTLNNR
jgi:hypothetical protein